MWSSPQEANRHIETGGFTSELILLFISNLSLLTNVEEGRIGRVTLLEIWFIVEGIDDDVFEGKVEECNSEYESIEKGINIEDGVHDNFLTVEPWEYKVSIVPNKSAKKIIESKNWYHPILILQQESMMNNLALQGVRNQGQWQMSRRKGNKCTNRHTAL